MYVGKKRDAAQEDPKLSLFFIDDHVVFSESVSYLLESTGLFEVYGSAVTGKAGIATIKKLKSPVDIIIIDYYLPDVYGLDLIGLARALSPGSSVVILTMESDPYVAEKSLEAGASAVLRKDVSSEQLVNMLLEVYRKSGRVRRKKKPRMEYVPETGVRQLHVNCFTRRERQVIDLVSKGKTTREIAELLFVSAKTIENHRNNILQKSGAKNMIELINYMIKKSQL